MKRFTATGIAIALLTTAAWPQSSVSSGEIVSALGGSVPAINAAGIDVVALRNDIHQRIVKEGKGTENAANPPPVLQELASLPNLTLVIEFDFDSDRIRPQSYPTIARIADALHHPVLRGYRFMVAGHTDAKGTREYNLDLSQRRADAVVEALTTTFNVEADRLGALGLGEEQLRSPSDAEGAVNRRVQILNLGPL